MFCVLLVATLACSSSPRLDRDARVTVEDGLRTDGLQLEYGHAWVHGSGRGGGRVRIVDGRASVPRWASAASAFIDADGNGHYDPFAEPGAHCELVGERWNCQVAARRVTVHRVVSARVSGREISKLGDHVTVLGESYDRAGRRAADIKVCLGGTQVCASAEGHAFGPPSNRVSAVSPCAVEATGRKPGTPIPIELKAGGSVAALSLTEPIDLAPQVDIHQDGDLLTVEGVVATAPTHILAWIGSTDASEVIWSTELDPASLHRRTLSFAVTIPLDRLRACATCKAMIQVVRVEPAHSYTSIAETRYVVDAGDRG